MERGQIVLKSKANFLLYLKKILWIKTSETSLVTEFMRHIQIIKWPYSNVTSVQLICSIKYGFLILTWIRSHFP